MRKISMIGLSVAIPVLVTLNMLGGFTRDFWGNFLFLASPVLLWTLVTCISNFSTATLWAGFCAAHAALLGLDFVFIACNCNSNAMGWLYLWPLFLILLILFILSVASVKACVLLYAHKKSKKMQLR